MTKTKKILSVFMSIATIVVGTYWIMEISAAAIAQPSMAIAIAFGLWATGMLIGIVSLVYTLMKPVILGPQQKNCGCDDCECEK